MENTNSTTPVVQIPQNNWLLILLVEILILVIGIAAGFLVGKYVYSPKIVQMPIPIVAASPTPVLITDSTANWKTYKYQQLFEIKIPNDLKIIDNGRIEIGDYLSIGMYPINPEACRGDCTIIETKISKKINGLEVRYLTGWWGEIGGNIAQSYIEYLIPQNGKYIYLQMQELPFSTKTSLVREKVGKVSEVNSKLLDQILSTFKFIGEKTLNSTFSVSLPEPFQPMRSSANVAAYGFDNFEYLVVTNTPTINLQSLRPWIECGKLIPGQFCLDNEGWGQAKDVDDITVGGIPAKSFYISGGVDNTYHIVQTTRTPILEFKMYVAGGGLDQRFQNFLSSLKFL